MRLRRLTLEEGQALVEEYFGNLDIHDTNVGELPKGLVVRGWFNAEKSKLKKLPDGFTTYGLADLRGCRKLKKLPSGLRIGGDLYLEGSGVKEVPDDAVIRGNVVWQGKKRGASSGLVIGTV